MRCGSCSTDTPGKTLKGTNYRCPVCGHQFVAIKKQHGLSDANVAKAVEQVSAKGTLYYRSAHLAYQLQRRLAANRRQARTGCLVVAVILAVAAAVMLFARLWIAMVVLSALAALAFRMRRSVESTDVFELVQRYEAVNPPKKHLPAREQLIERERGREALHAGLRGAAHILVCHQRGDAEFLVANDFHLQHACPVTGPDGKAIDGFPELATRLARGGPLHLFVLHDFTPAGAGFLRRLRQLPDILKRRDPVTIVDMGFDERHRPMLETALSPLGKIRGSFDASPGTTWHGEHGAQVAALLPALLLAAAGTSIAERAPIRVPEKEPEDDDGHDSDNGDSE